MIVHQGVYLPDGETHLVDWMTKAGELVDGKGTYQIKKLRAALDHCKQFRTAVDVGAHCGLWSMQLVKRFETVVAFEPVAAHRECFAANLGEPIDVTRIASKTKEVIQTLPVSVEMHACALGDHEDAIKIITEPTSSGDSRVNPATLRACALGEKEGGVRMLEQPTITCKARVLGPGEIPMHTLDSFELQDVDFIKIDTEGFELYVIRGGEETIKRCRPTMIVEQKGHGMKYFGFRKEEGIELLESWGMKRALERSGDWVMVWP